MNQELILKELEEALQRQVNAIERVHMTNGDRIEALDLIEFTVDPQRAEGGYWHDAIVWKQDTRREEKIEALQATYRDLRASVVLDAVTDLPKLKEFLSA